MRTIKLLAVMTLAMLFFPILAYSQCGKERWAQKVLLDKEIKLIDFQNIIDTSVHALYELEPHCSGKREIRGEGWEEYAVFRVKGVVECLKREDDRDWHLCLKDSSSNETMIIEFPAQECIGKNNTKDKDIIDAREFVDKNHKTLIGQTIEVTGVGFYDKAHGQKGMAKSCLELHPVLSIKLVKNKYIIDLLESK